MTALDPRRLRAPRRGRPAAKPAPRSCCTSLLTLGLVADGRAVRLDGPGLVQAAGRVPAPAARRGCPSSRPSNNYQRLVDQLDMPRFFFNSIVVAMVVTIGNLIFAPDARLRAGQAPVRRQGLLMALVLATLMLPGAAILVPAVRADERARAREHLPGADPAVPRRAVRRVPDAPVLLGPAGRAARGRPDRRSQRVPDLLDDRHAARRSRSSRRSAS